MFIRLLIFFILGVVIYRAVKSWFAQVDHQKVDNTQNKPLRADDVMIQDPYCGVYFARRDGVTLNYQGKELHFCSESCREKYLTQQGNND